MIAGKLVVVGVLVALAVAVAVVHPSLPGNACGDFPLCYLGALASPESARSPQGVVVMLVALGKALALGWLLGSMAETRALNASAHALRAAGGVPAPLPARRHLPHLLLVLMMTLGWLLHAPAAQMPSRVEHLISGVLAGAAVVAGWAGLIPGVGAFDALWRTLGKRASGHRALGKGVTGGESGARPERALLPLLLAMAVVFFALATPLLQFESGLFSCGESGEFCLSDGRLGAHLPLLVETHKILLFVTSLTVFAYGVRCVWERRRAEALWLPWLAAAWVGTLLLRDSFESPLAAFAPHQAMQWLLIVGLLRLALRQGSEAGNAETDGIGTSGNNADGVDSSPIA